MKHKSPGRITRVPSSSCPGTRRNGSSTRRCARTGSRRATASGIAARGVTARLSALLIRPPARARPPSIMCGWRRRSPRRRGRTCPYTPALRDHQLRQRRAGNPSSRREEALDMRPDDLCMRAVRNEEPPKTEVRSPDGRWAAFVRDNNLFVRETATGAERQMTTDGEPYNAYAALPGSSLSAVTDRVIGRPATPALQWSPDSTKFVTYRLDERHVRDMHLLQSVPTDGTARPTLHPYRYPLPGDAHVPLAHLVVVNVARGRRSRCTPSRSPP